MIWIAFCVAVSKVEGPQRLPQDRTAVAVAVRDVHDRRAVGAALAHGAADGRLARADVAGDQHEALAHADRVFDGRQRFAVLLALEEEPRVGRVLERHGRQVVKLVIHNEIPA
jgi:hypothetical protein